MDFHKFDHDFDRGFRRTQRITSLAMFFAFVWFIFLAGCLGTALFLLGRWTGVW